MAVPPLPRPSGSTGSTSWPHCSGTATCWSCSSPAFLRSLAALLRLLRHVQLVNRLLDYVEVKISHVDQIEAAGDAGPPLLRQRLVSRKLILAGSSLTLVSRGHAWQTSILITSGSEFHRSISHRTITGCWGWSGLNRTRGSLSRR